MTQRVKRYKMPAGCPVASADIRELNGRQYTEAAEMVDAGGAGANPSVRDMVASERREAIRLSIVALGDRAIDHVVPLYEIDDWSRKAREALARYFDDMNGLDGPVLAELIAKAEILTDGKGRHGKRFALPPECSVPSVEIWELGGHEELAASYKADSMPDAGVAVSALRRRREIVGAAMRGQVAEWDAWSLRTITAISIYFEDVNGIPSEEISGCVAAAVEISGAAPAKSSEPPAPEVAARTG